MSWFHRNRGPSPEALKALANAKVLAKDGEILRKRADKVSAQLTAHREDNGFASIVASIYGKR